MAGPFRLVDYFAVVTHTDPPELERAITAPEDVTKVTFKCHVRDRFPEKDYDKQCVIPLNFPMFCYANGWQFATNARTPSVHPFVLTLVDGTHIYCMILTLYEVCQPPMLTVLHSMPNIILPTDDVLFSPISLCIISHWPLYSQFTQFLVQLHTLYTSGSAVPPERWIQHFVTSVPLPPPGKIAVLYKMPSSTITFVRPTVNSLPLADVPFELLFRVLDLQNVVLLWSVVLLEFKVVMHSKHAALLGIVSECITALLYPFKWFHIYIPLLPQPLVQYVHCPCPYVIGVNVGSRSVVDIPSEAVVVDLDNNSISLPSPPPPPLPEKQKNKLMKKLKAMANIFERPGELSDQFDFGSYFLKRNQGATNVKTKESKKKEMFDEQGVRNAFLQFFVSIMKNYRKAIVESTFSLPVFLKYHPSSDEEFITHLCTQSQGFQQFVNSRKNVAAHDTSEIVLFDEYIIQKKNRLNHLMKDKDTPFLNDTSHTVVRTFEVPAVDTTHLDKNLYQYTTFPRLDPKLLSTNVKEAPQLVDQTTGVFRSQIPNKELAILWDIVNANASSPPLKARSKTGNVKLFNRGTKDLNVLWSKKHLGKKYEHVLASIVKIQVYQKGKSLRKDFVALRRATPLLQNVIRTWGQRWQYQQTRRFALLVQTLLRGHSQACKYQRMRSVSVALQTHVRAWVARTRLRRVREAAVRIQATARSAMCRRQFIHMQLAATVLQSSLRKHGVVNYFLATRSAIIVLQTDMRRAWGVRSFQQYKQCVVRVQSVVRRHQAMVRVGREHLGLFDDVRCRVLQRWNQLHTSKLHRAMFLVSFRSVTIANLLMLLEEEKALDSSAGASQAPTKQCKELLAAEQKYLYHMLNSFQPEGGINQVYVKWNVDSTGRKRKQHLCEVLFSHPNNLQESIECAELVCHLVGVYQVCANTVHKTKFTHKMFLDQVEHTRVQLMSNVNKRSCVLL
eukprot:Phypoly_transcript_01984.p1 GENE.Phypoly_transcript_01984~~Phypoly_transcript_01984.p1  ORF type:complete len:956 (+),score=127.35 Phypoly_transcript_01984:107-2974(+)